MKPLHTFALILATLLPAGLLSRSAHAQDVRGDRVEVTGPNRALLRSGVWTLGLSYVPALVVAIESDLPEDDHLYIPVAGPWLDLGTRDCDTCEHENMNKALLVTDGVIQGIGALQIMGSFLFLETRTRVAGTPRKRSVASAPRFVITPAKLGSAYGLAAKAKF